MRGVFRADSLRVRSEFAAPPPTPALEGQWVSLLDIEALWKAGGDWGEGWQSRSGLEPASTGREPSGRWELS